MMDYTLLQLSRAKQRDVLRERAYDRLAGIARCCQSSAVVRWLRRWQPVRPAATCTACA